MVPNDSSNKHYIIGYIQQKIYNDTKNIAIIDLYTTIIVPTYILGDPTYQLRTA